jgi:hypothetical protein
MHIQRAAKALDQGDRAGLGLQSVIDLTCDVTWVDLARQFRP